MKYTQIIFSPTGGTKKAAQALWKSFRPYETVDLSVPDDDYEKYTFTSEDVVLIAMPSFGGLAPKTALERLSKISGSSARCVIAAVYGNRAYEDTLVRMEDAAEKCGFRVIAAVAAVAEHSIIHKYAAGRPDGADCDCLADFAAKIGEKIRSGSLTKPHIPGSRPYKKAGSLGLVPKADSACTGCGICAESCPVRAIDPQKLKTANAKKCISCMRCVSVCPEKARKPNTVMVSAAALAIKKACREPKQNELFY